MNTQARRLAMATAMLWFGFGGGGRAEASPVLTTPAGLSPGDHFRFVFVTDGTTTATSSNINDYNTFVTEQAGGATYNGQPITWVAIASTPTVNAIDNVGLTQDPVYLADGTKVTTSTTTSGLWSGTLLHVIDEDLSGKADSRIGLDRYQPHGHHLRDIRIHQLQQSGVSTRDPAAPTSPV